MKAITPQSVFESAALALHFGTLSSPRGCALSADPPVRVGVKLANEEVERSALRGGDGLAAGLIVRSHGKATPSLHPMMIRRQRANLKEKIRIAKKAAEMIGNGDTVMIDSGTTTAMIPRYLIGKRDIHVITNSILQIPHFRLNPSITFTMVGGEFRFLDECFVGPLSLDALSRFNVKYAFIGTIGFSGDYGLTTYSLDIADIILQMVRRADKVVLCADSSKWGKKGNVNTIPLSEVDYLITDDVINKEFQRQVEEQGVEIIIA